MPPGKSEEADGGWYPSRLDVDNIVGSRFKPKARQQLTAKRWLASFDREGRLIDMESVLQHVQTGGVEHSIRREVWEFLLGCFSPQSTASERRQIRMHRRELYVRLKAQCKELDPAIGEGVVVTMPRQSPNNPGTPVTPMTPDGEAPADAKRVLASTGSSRFDMATDASPGSHNDSHHRRMYDSSPARLHSSHFGPLTSDDEISTTTEPVEPRAVGWGMGSERDMSSQMSSAEQSSDEDQDISIDGIGSALTERLSSLSGRSSADRRRLEDNAPPSYRHGRNNNDRNGDIVTSYHNNWSPPSSAGGSTSRVPASPAMSEQLFDLFTPKGLPGSATAVSARPRHRSSTPAWLGDSPMAADIVDRLSADPHVSGSLQTTPRTSTALMANQITRSMSVRSSPSSNAAPTAPPLQLAWTPSGASSARDHTSDGRSGAFRDKTLTRRSSFNGGSSSARSSSFRRSDGNHASSPVSARRQGNDASTPPTPPQASPFRHDPPTIPSSPDGVFEMDTPSNHLAQPSPARSMFGNLASPSNAYGNTPTHPFPHIPPRSSADTPGSRSSTGFEDRTATTNRFPLSPTDMPMSQMSARSSVDTPGSSQHFRASPGRMTSSSGPEPSFREFNVHGGGGFGAHLQRSLSAVGVPSAPSETPTSLYASPMSRYGGSSATSTPTSRRWGDPMLKRWGMAGSDAGVEGGSEMTEGFETRSSASSSPTTTPMLMKGWVSVNGRAEYRGGEDEAGGGGSSRRASHRTHRWALSEADDVRRVPPPQRPPPPAPPPPGEGDGVTGTNGFWPRGTSGSEETKGPQKGRSPAEAEKINRRAGSQRLSADWGGDWVAALHDRESRDGFPGAAGPYMDSPNPEGRTPQQEAEFLERAEKWRDTLHQIGMDVVRTDRQLLFYETEANQAKLFEMLAVYAWLDPDILYCQGMSDLLSPFLVIFPNEADAFWCFVRLMLRVRDNFKGDRSQMGVRKQLDSLGTILHEVDPELHAHLDRIGAGDFLFALRMLLAMFRRELSFGDTLYLWEMIWAAEYELEAAMEAAGKEDPAVRSGRRPRRPSVPMRVKGKYGVVGMFAKRQRKYGFPGGYSGWEGEGMVVFCTAAVLVQHRTRILRAAEDAHEEVLRLFNDVVGKVDVKAVCKLALALHKKYLIQSRKTHQVPKVNL